jgi:hypothetical protein
MMRKDSQDVGGNDPIPEEVAADNGHEGNADLQMLEARPEDCPRHCHKMVTPSDVSLLHHSTRIETLNKGFNTNIVVTANARVATPASKGKKNKGKKVVEISMTTAYVGHSTAGVSPASHLSASNA